MRHHLHVVPFALLLSGCAVIPEGARPSASLRTEVASQNNFRGMVNADAPVLRTGLDVGIDTKAPGGRLTAITQATWDLRNDIGTAWFPGGHAGEYSQVDIGLMYSETFRGVDFSSGVISYAHQNPDDFPFAAERGETKEVFFLVEKPLEKGIVPSLFLQYDIDEVHDLYATLALAKRFERNAFSSEFKLALSHSGSGQSEWNYGIAESGFSDASISGRMNFVLDPHSVLYFGANASTIVDTQIEEWFELLGIESTNLWVTVGLVWTY
jgi:hypothetical protein